MKIPCWPWWSFAIIVSVCLVCVTNAEEKGKPPPDLDHAEYETRSCNDTLVKDICESAQRNCNTTLNPRIVKYKGIRKIVSPTKNLSIDAATIETLKITVPVEYELKELEKIFTIGDGFMRLTERTKLFELVTIIVKQFLKPAANETKGSLNQKEILDIVEYQLNWFMVIAFGLLVVVGLTIFVSFSMLDGVFGWSDSTRVQRRLPSNAMYVNVHGVLIGLITGLVLMGCLLGWVGNLLVTESKTQSRTQGLTNWEWSDSYSWQGKQQFNDLVLQYTHQLIPEILRLYNELLPTARDNIHKATNYTKSDFMNSAAKLEYYIEKLDQINTITTLVNETVDILNEVFATAKVCEEQIPWAITVYCTDLGFATDLAGCATALADEEITVVKKDGDTPEVIMVLPDLQLFNGTMANTTEIYSERLRNASLKINTARTEKLYDAALAGNARWQSILSVLWERSKTERTAYYNLLDQTVRQADSQFAAFSDLQETSLRSFVRGKQYVNFFLGDDSNMANLNQMRYQVFVVVISLCAITVSVGTAAWCIGCCNFNEKQWPFQREGISHAAGTIIYFSSYMALFLSLFTISMGVIYFIPTSLINFSCIVFQDAQASYKGSANADVNFFQFFDEEVLVDHQILGRYIHKNDDKDLTFQYFMRMCENDKGLYTALKLSDRWDLIGIFYLNDTLDVTDHLSLLKLINFKDQYLLMPPKVLVLEALAETMATLGPFAPLKTKINSTSHIFGKNKDDTAFQLWILNFEVFHKLAKALCAKYTQQNNPTEFGKCKVYTETCADSIIGTAEPKKSWSKRSIEFEKLLLPFDGIFDTLEPNVDKTTEWSVKHVKKHIDAEKEFLMTLGPLKLNETVDEYIGHVYEEIDCFTYTAVGQVEQEMGQCRTLFDVYNSTMFYFCKFLVGSMTITWVSMFMIGSALTLYIQIARAVSMYFLRMDEIHPDDITQEDKIAAMTGGKGL